MEGTLQLQELISLSFAIIIPIIKEKKKDGFQYKDLLAFIDSDDFKTHLQNTIKGFNKLLPEVKDLTAEEYIDLTAHTLKEIKSLVETLK